MIENKRIKKAINWLISQGLASSQKEVGEKLGITNRSYLSQLVNSETPNEQFVNKFTALFSELNPQWLLTGEGEMLKQQKNEPSNASRIGHPYSVTSQDDETVFVRFFQVTPTATFQEFCEGASEEPDFVAIVPPNGELIDDSSCIFEITGESMAPQIPDGARVLCREVSPSKWHNIPRGVIVIAYDDRFVIKRIVKNCLSTDNYLLLASDNPDYPTEEMASLADIRCIFQALHVLSFPIR